MYCIKTQLKTFLSKKTFNFKDAMKLDKKKINNKKIELMRNENQYDIIFIIK